MFKNLFKNRNSLTKFRIINAFIIGKRSYSLENKIFNCPRKEFAKYINHYNLEIDKDNYSPGFVYKDKLWNLYLEIDGNYEFTEIDLRTLLKLSPFTAVEDELKLKRVQGIIDKMIDLGFNPGGDGLMALISTYASFPNAMDKIEGLLYSWKHSPPQTKRVYNILLRVYAKTHGTQVAEKWFDSLIGTMIYTETGIKTQSLRPLIKDGGIYTQLIRMYCEEGNLSMAITKFNEMFRKFDQSNRSGSLGRILNLLLKEGKFYEALAWYTTAKLYYMRFDETGYFKVIKAILFYAFSKNVFINAADFINMLGEHGSEWKLKENELSGFKGEDSALITLMSDLNVEKVVEQQADSSAWYYSKDNCLDTEKPVESDQDSEISEELEVAQSHVPDHLKEIKELFKNQKFGDKCVVNQDSMPLEYDQGFLKTNPHGMMKLVLADMFKKAPPSILTFNSIIYCYYKVGAFEECAKIFEYMKARLDITHDPVTISIMTKVYQKVGQYGKSVALGRLDNSEIMEGDLLAVGTQFDVMLSAGRYHELEEVFKDLDDTRDLGSRNLTYALRMYVKENKMDEAKRLFERIITVQIEEGKQTAVPFNVMLNKYALMGDMYSFNDLLDRMKELGIELNEDTYVSIMRAYISWNDPETALEYYRKMIAQDIEQSLHSFHAIMSLFTKMNNEAGIMEIIKTMIMKGIVPNDQTLGLVVGYYVNLGKVEEAHQIQDLFQKSFAHLSSSMRCHNTIINYYTKLGDSTGALRELHRATTVYKATPDIFTYTCMVKVFAPTDIKAARKIFDLALEKCVHSLDEGIFAIMMGAYYDVGDYDSAMEIYTRMNALDVAPDQKILKILSRLQATGAASAMPRGTRQLGPKKT